MPGQVDEAVMEERLARLQALLAEQQRAFNAEQEGKVLPVLFDKPGRHPGQILGRSPYLQAVHADGPQTLIGKIVPVRIRSAAMNSLTGELALEPSRSSTSQADSAKKIPA
jgi:tRNA-2-methylthio-N6-dimethylallyladenosine synthase